MRVCGCVGQSLGGRHVLACRSTILYKRQREKKEKLDWMWSMKLMSASSGGIR